MQTPESIYSNAKWKLDFLKLLRGGQKILIKKCLFQSNHSIWITGKTTRFVSTLVQRAGTQQIWELPPQAGALMLHKSSSSRVAPFVIWEPWASCQRGNLELPAPKPELNLQEPFLELSLSQIPTSQLAGSRLEVLESVTWRQWV